MRRSAALCCALFAAIAAPGLAHAQSGNMVHIDPAFAADPAMLQKMAPVLSVLGSGYNSLTKEVIGSGGCVTGTVIPPGGGGYSVTYQLEFVSSLDQFLRDTSVEASVSGSFGAFSGSVKSKFAESEKSHTTSTHLLIREFVHTAEVDLNNPRLKLGKSIILLAAAKNPEKYDFFMRSCGDTYVSGAYMGGEFIALLSSETSDEEIKQSISASASASYSGISSFSASADFNQDVSKFKSRSNLSVTMTRIGGTGDLPVLSTAEGPQSVDAIISYAAKLPENVSQFPVVYGLKAQSYSQAGVDLAEPDAAHATYDRLQKNEDTLGATILGLQIELKSFDLLGVPIQPEPGDARHTALASLTKAEADFTSLSQELEQCGHAFWRPHSCDAEARFLADTYTPPRMPSLIVRKLVLTSGETVSVPIPSRMKIGLRGAYCFGVGYPCITNGSGRYGDTYVTVQRPGGPVEVYDGKEHDSDAGDINIQIHDTYYFDNTGDLYFVAYEDH